MVGRNTHSSLIILSISRLATMAKMVTHHTPYRGSYDAKQMTRYPAAIRHDEDTSLSPSGVHART